MRRPALHHRTAPSTGWAHPYTGTAALATFYNDGGDEQEPAAAPEPPKPAPPATKMFTQDEVAALAAKEKSQGKRAGASEALAQFATDNGFNSVEDAKNFIEEARKAREAQLSEAEKREQALAKKEAELAAREAAAVARERAAARRSVLAGLGATGEDLEDAAALLRVEDDADDATLVEAAEALKTRRPELFGTARPAAVASTLPPAPGGAPAGGLPTRQTPSGKPGDRGREMARLRGHKPAA